MDGFITLETERLLLRNHSLDDLIKHHDPISQKGNYKNSGYILTVCNRLCSIVLFFYPIYVNVLTTPFSNTSPYKIPSPSPPAPVSLRPQYTHLDFHLPALNQ